MFLVMEVMVEVIMERGQLNQDMVAMEVAEDMVGVTPLMEVDMEVMVEVIMERGLLNLDMVDMEAAMDMV